MLRGVVVVIIVTTPFVFGFVKQIDDDDDNGEPIDRDDERSLELGVVGLNGPELSESVGELELVYG